ncbi:DNA primase [Streptococcus moroccensis]|uniref:DNA primase n=1 Tax=Streptococcus moroccensis TaxID=1451356 RepID=A0ABT9YUK7_9STRE|nr:DNA primase [Streptococcus moroccensis]MDQ0223038.1 DNA primase [Streptococcus moroccensis]
MDKDFITEVKSNVNIVDVIGEVVSLTKAGRNFLGLCPFHGEKTPSFNVVEDKQFFHCFGCGKSGDVFKFIQDYRDVSFLDSVAIVAEKAGIPLPTVNVEFSRQKVSPHQSLYDIHKAAADFYHTVLMTTKLGERARSYLYDRGLDDDVIKHFHLGLSPNEGDYLYKALSAQFDEQTLLNSALFNPSENQKIYDAFQNRIMFPLTDDSGRIIAFSGRIWQTQDMSSQEAKYKNSRASLIFNKSYELYHLSQAKASIRKHHEVYIMEGFMDVIAAYRAGIENTVASMGTALTSEHVQHLSHHTQKAVLVYDGDKAGQAATAKALDVLKPFVVEIVRLPDQMDPDEFIQKNSTEELANFLTKQRLSPVEFLLYYLKPDNLENLQAQIRFVEQMAPIIAQTSSITAQNTYIHKLAELLPDFDFGQVEASVDQVRVAQRTHHQQPIQQESYRRRVTEMPFLRQPSPLQRAENQLFNRMVHHGFVLNDYRQRDDFQFVSQELQTLYQLLCQQGEITAVELSQLDEAVQNAWYLAMEENLPEDVSMDELYDIERTRQRELLKQDSRQIAQRIREQSNIGNDIAAVDELNRLIAQKRNME